MVKICLPHAISRRIRRLSLRHAGRQRQSLHLEGLERRLLLDASPLGAPWVQPQDEGDGVKIAASVAFDNSVGTSLLDGLGLVRPWVEGLTSVLDGFSDTPVPFLGQTWEALLTSGTSVGTSLEAIVADIQTQTDAYVAANPGAMQTELLATFISNALSGVTVTDLSVGPGAIELGVSVTLATIHTGFEIDLIEQLATQIDGFEISGVNAGANAILTADTTFNFMVGVDDISLGGANDFYLRDPNLALAIDASATFDLGVNLGVFEAVINNATFGFQADYVIDKGVLPDIVFRSGDLQDTGSGFDFGSLAASFGTDSLFNFDVPLSILSFGGIGPFSLPTFGGSSSKPAGSGADATSLFSNITWTLPDLSLPAFADLVDFSDLSLNEVFDQIVSGLNFIFDSGDNPNHPDGIAYQKLPILDLSLNELLELDMSFLAGLGVDLGDLSNVLNNLPGIDGIDLTTHGVLPFNLAFQAGVEGIRQLTPGLQGLEDAFNTLLNFDGGVVEDRLTLILDTAAAAPFDKELIFEFNFDYSFANETFDFALNLADLAAFTPDNPFGDAGLFTVAGGGNISVSAGAGLVLGVGLGLNGISLPTPFVTDTSGVTFGVSARGENLDFTASVNVPILGSVGVAVVHGQAALDEDGDATTLDQANVRLGLKDDSAGDHRYLLSELTNINNYDYAITAGLGFDLPLYFPTPTIPLGGSDQDDDNDGVLDNVLQMRSDFDKQGLSNVSIVTPRLSNQFNIFDIFNNPTLFVDAFDGVLNAVQAGLNGGIFDVTLPLIGKISDTTAAQSVTQFIADIQSSIIGTYDDPGTPQDEGTGLKGYVQGKTTVEVLQEALYNLLGPGTAFGFAGLNILVNDQNQKITSSDEIKLEITEDYAQFNIRMADELVDFSVPIDFSAGVAGLGLDVEGVIEVHLGYVFEFGLGVNFNEAEFYFDTSGAIAGGDEFQLTIDATAPGLDAEGVLGFLQLNVNDVLDYAPDWRTSGSGSRPSGLFGAFAVDLKDPSGEGRLTISEIQSHKNHIGTIIEAKLQAEADVDLFAELTVPEFGGFQFPSLMTTVHYDQQFVNASTAVDTQSFGGTPLVEFADVTIDVGPTITKFLGPIVSQINDIVEPLEPIVNVLTTPISILEKLGASQTTLLDIAKVAMGQTKYAPVAKGVEALAGLISFVTSINDFIDTVGGDSILINLGSFNVGGDLRSGMGEVPVGAGAGFDLDNAINNVGGLSPEKKVATTTVTSKFGVKPGSISFPILTSPTEAFGLLLGKADTRLFEYELPSLALDFTYVKSFPIFAGLNARFGGGIKADTNFAFGYDMTGILQFKNAHFQAFALPNLFNGFYVSDNGIQGTPNDLPELTLETSVIAGASVGIRGLIEAGVEGGIRAGIEFNLHDLPNPGTGKGTGKAAVYDGRIRPNEIGILLSSVVDGIPCLFDTRGSISAFLDAFFWVGLDLGFFGKITLFEARKTFVNEVLASFERFCPDPEPPDLAVLQGGVLTVRYLPTDGPNTKPELFTVDQGMIPINPADLSQGFHERIIVQSRGFQEDFDPATVATIVLNGTPYDDILTVTENVQANVVMHGSGGNDTLEVASVFAGFTRAIYGDDGDDLIAGGDGPDTIEGGLGNDVIEARGGADLVYANSATPTGNETVRTQVTNAGLANERITVLVNNMISGGEGDDLIYGANSRDVILGDGGADVIYGGDGPDEIMGHNLNRDADERDELYGQGGADTLKGGGGNDLIRGGEGDDTLTGGTGSDELYGENGADTFNWAFGDGADAVVQGGSSLVFDLNVGGNVETTDVMQMMHIGVFDDNLVVTASGLNVTVSWSGQSLPLEGIERLSIDVSGGRDSVTVNNLSGSTVRNIDIDLGSIITNTIETRPLLDNAGQPVLEYAPGSDVPVPGTFKIITQQVVIDGSPDTIHLFGSAGTDDFTVGTASDDGSGFGPSVFVNQAGGVNMMLTNTQKVNDILIIETLAGGDIIDASLVAEDIIDWQFWAGADGDTITGTPFKDTIDSGMGDDFVTGRRGVDIFLDAGGIDTLIEETDELGAEFTLTDTVLVIGSETEAINNIFEEVFLTATNLNSTLNGEIHDLDDDGFKLPLPVVDETRYDNVFRVSHWTHIAHLNGGEAADLYLIDLNATGGVTETAEILIEDFAYQTVIGEIVPGNGFDRVDVYGTDLADVFALRTDVIEKISAANGNFTPAQEFSTDIDIRDTHSTAGFRQVVDYLSTENVYLFAGDGADLMIMDDTSVELFVYGEGGNDLFFVGNVLSTKPFEHDKLGTIEVVDEITNGVSFPAVLLGGEGEDYFEVNHNVAPIALFGEAGNDTFFIKALLTTQSANNIGGINSSDAEITVHSAAGEQDILSYVKNAPINIHGGEGFDTVVVVGTAIDDVFTIFVELEDGVPVQRVYGAGLNIPEIDSIERLVIVTGGGDDTVYVYGILSGQIIEVNTGTGNDTVYLGGDTRDFQVMVPEYKRTEYEVTPAYKDEQYQVVTREGFYQMVVTYPYNFFGVFMPFKFYTSQWVPPVIETRTRTVRDAENDIVTPVTVTIPEQVVPVHVHETRVMTGLQGAITLTSPSGEGDHIFVNNQHATAGANSTGELSVTNTGKGILTGLGLGAAGVVYDGFDVVDIFLGNENDNFVVTDTVDKSTTTIYAGGGDDQVRVKQVGGPTSVFGDFIADYRQYLTALAGQFGVIDGPFDPSNVEHLRLLAVDLNAEFGLGINVGGITDVLNIDIDNYANEIWQILVNNSPVSGSSGNFRNYPEVLGEILQLPNADGTGWFFDETKVSHVKTLARAINVDFHLGIDVFGIDYVPNFDLDAYGDYVWRLLAGRYAVIDDTPGAEAFVAASDSLGLNLLAAPVLFDGQGGINTLLLDDSGRSVSNQGVLMQNTISGLNATGGVAYSNIATLTIKLSQGANTFTVSSTHKGLTRLEGNGGGDIFNVKTIAGATTIATGSGDDTVNVGTLAPLTGGLLDAVDAALIVDGGGGADQLCLDDTGDVTDNQGTSTATTIIGLGLSPSGITYQAFEALHIHLGSGADHFDIADTHTGTTIVTGGLGSDQLNVLAVSGLTMVDAQGGDDVINVGSLAPNYGGVLNNLHVGVTVLGSDGLDTLNLDDSGDTTANTGALDSALLTGFGLAPEGLAYQDVETFNLRLGSATDVLTVVGTHFGETTLNLGGGDDRGYLRAIAGQVSVVSGSGANVIDVGSLAPQTSGILADVTGHLLVQGTDGTTTLNLDHTGDSQEVSVLVTGSTVTGTLLPGVVEYVNVAALNINLGDGSDVLNVQATTAQTTVNLNGGDDDIYVSSLADFAPNATPESLLGVLDGIQGDLIIHAGTGSHRLLISDIDSTVADTGAMITDQVSSFSSAEIALTGFASKAIAYSSDADGNFARGITYWTGSGDDVIGIDGVLVRTGVVTPATLFTGAGADHIILSLDQADGLLLVHGQGGDDTIDGTMSMRSLVIFGDDGNDTISGGSDSDILFGDFGTVDIAAQIGTAFQSLATTSPAGGNDTIMGGPGDDFILGQQGDDTLSGGGGEDDIWGGHNVDGGSDGNDTIDGGDDADVILGDSGAIVRTLANPGPWQRYPALFADVVRSVSLWANGSGTWGNDHIEGGGGRDIVYGQNGDDLLTGGAHDDELFGGLGNDQLAGDDGNDILISHLGSIVRLLDNNGQPVVDTNGSWHRDVLLEDTGTLTGMVNISAMLTSEELAAFTEQLLAADLVVLAGAYTTDGAKVIADGSGRWDTVALFIDLADVNHNHLDGGAGEDVLFGHRGNDTIFGGDDNDILFGDAALNLAPFVGDILTIYNSLRITTAASGLPVTLGANGSVIANPITLLPNDLNATSPYLFAASVGAVLPDVVNEFTQSVSIGPLTRTDGTVLRPYVSLVSDVLGHTDVLSGSDMLSGEGGNDLIFGDGGTFYSELAGEPVALSQARDTAWNTFHAALDGLHTLALDYEQYQVAQNGGSAYPRVLSIGGDSLSGGTGNDLIFGDNGLVIQSFISGTPSDSLRYVDQAVQAHNYLLDLNTLVSDLDLTVFGAHYALLQTQIDTALVTNPAAIPPAHTLRVNPSLHEFEIGNDTLDGGPGNDLLVGDDATIITAALGQNSGQITVSLSVQTATNSLLTQAAANYTQQWQQHIRHDFMPDTLSFTPRQLDLINYDYEYQRRFSNDVIHGQGGDDLIFGDYAIVTAPVLASEMDAATISNEAEQWLTDVSRFVARQYQVQFGSEYTANHSTAAIHRGGSLNTALVEAGNDTITGDDGDNIILGDSAAVSTVYRPDGNTPNIDTTGFFGVRQLEILTHLRHGGQPLDAASILESDTIDGGAGAYVVLGQWGDDILTGGSLGSILQGGLGNDQVSGGEATNGDGSSLPGLAQQPVLAGRLTETLDPLGQLLLGVVGESAPTADNLAFNVLDGNRLTLEQLGTPAAVSLGAQTYPLNTQTGDSFVALLDAGKVPAYIEVLATVALGRAQGSLQANGYLVFDYVDTEHFKFAGVSATTGAIEIGSRTPQGWSVAASVLGGVVEKQAYQLRLFLDGSTASLLVDSGHVLTHTFDDAFMGGALGLGVNNSRSTYSSVDVITFSAPGQSAPDGAEVTLPENPDPGNPPVMTEYVPDAFEADNTPNHATTIGLNTTSDTHSIHVADDEDWFRFILKSPLNTVTIFTQGLANSDTQIALYSVIDTTTPLAVNDDNGVNLYSTIHRGGDNALPAGTYYVQVFSHGQAETIEAYTLSVASSVLTSKADLQADSLIVDGGVYHRGETIDLSALLTNLGDKAAGAFRYEAKLSLDQIWGNDDDIVLINSLISGGLSVSGEQMIHVTPAMPATTPQGTYYLGVMADSRTTIAESDETNNVAWTANADLTVVDTTTQVLSRNHNVTLTDGHGVKVTVRLTGPGQGQVYTLGGFDDIYIELSGTTTDSKLQITSWGGKATLGRVNIDGALNLLQGKNTVLTGSLDITDGVNKLYLGDVTEEAGVYVGAASRGTTVIAGNVSGSQLEFAGRVNTFNVAQFTEGNFAAESLGKAFIRNGDLGATINVQQGILSLQTKYSITGILSTHSGSIGRLIVRGDVSGYIYAGQDVGSLHVWGTISGDVVEANSEAL